MKKLILKKVSRSQKHEKFPGMQIIGSYEGPEMLVFEDETEDLIQRFSAVSLMDCGKYGNLSSADNLCKWFGPRLGPTECSS